MRTQRRYQSGFTLPFVALVAFGLAILIFSVAQSTKTNTHQMLYFNNMNRVYRLAESGMTSSLGKLSINSSVTHFQDVVTGEGEYESFVVAVSCPTFGSYYMVTSATRTAGGKTYACKLHTYASVANIGDYFAIFQNEYITSPGMNAANGKIYAPNITCLVSSSVVNPTRILQAEYVYVARAKNEWNPTQIWNSNVWPISGINGTPIAVNEVQIGANPFASDPPIQLTELKRLPVVSDSDMDRYKNFLGGALHTLTIGVPLSGAIAPPGYQGPLVAGDAYEASYPGSHTTNNEEHVYYSDGDMTIGDPSVDTVIYGQVLFVAKGNIHIQGNVRMATDPNFPGQGSLPIHIGSSTAHQAVFLTQANIVYDVAAMAPAAGTYTLEGMLYAPQGVLDVTPRIGAVVVMNFNFTGSQLLAGTKLEPNNLPTQFRGTRTYNYMASLKTNPPPYLPALVTHYYSWEEITASPGLF